MSEGKNTYEGMFLVSPNQSDFERAGEPVRAVLGRSEAEILSIKPWDERRLVYEIDGNLQPVDHYYLGDPEAAESAAQAVADQAKG